MKIQILSDQKDKWRGKVTEIFVFDRVLTVPNNSYRFWADLHLKCYRVYLTFINIDPKCHSYLVYEPDNGKLKIHSVIQNLLKLADLQSIKGTCFNVE